MFELIKLHHKKNLRDIVKLINESEIGTIAKELYSLIEQIRSEIPEKKRISYGRYSIIKKLGTEFYQLIEEERIDTFNFAKHLFERKEHDQFVRSMALQLVSIYGCETGNLKEVLEIFEIAAIDELWEIRECSAGFICKLTKKYPNEMRRWYLKQVKSENPLMRRFASESIRPVADNAWFKKSPDFCFEILEHLYEEPNAYPRTSVGNNLSDWAKRDKERVFKIVERLVNSKNKNSYWIAYRACRNLVKTEPLRVMDLLEVEEYKYKNRIHRRKDFN